jgi:hypothetical protein
MITPRFYQISLRTIFELVFLAAVVFAFLYWRNVPRRELGRYQIEAIEHGQVLYIDTATGKVWRGNPTGAVWREVPTPADEAK